MSMLSEIETLDRIRISINALFGLWCAIGKACARTLALRARTPQSFSCYLFLSPSNLLRRQGVSYRKHNLCLHKVTQGGVRASF